MNNKLIEAFFAETAGVFLFLEKQYGYHRLEQDIKAPNDIRDATARVRYIGPRIGIEIEWGFTAGVITVIFIELLQSGVFPTAVSLFPFRDQSNTAKGISLYDLAEMLGHINDHDFVLKKIDNFRTTNKRIRMIQEQMHAILAGLANATQTYATLILQGDSTIFPQVMRFYVEKYKRIYPSMHLPPGVIDDLS